MRAHYEGDSFQNHQKEAAYASIASSQYQGEHHNFSFETYITLHQKAHMELEWNGEPVPESKKVRDFLMGIQDPQLAPAKGTVVAMMQLRNSFTKASNFLSNFVETTQKMHKMPRSIASLTGWGFQWGHGWSPGGCEGSCFGGRGCRCGHGHGKGHEGHGHGELIVDCYYSPKEWAALSYTDKGKVIQIRENKKRNIDALLVIMTPVVPQEAIVRYQV